MNRYIKKRIILTSSFLLLFVILNFTLSHSYHVSIINNTESNTTLAFKSSGVTINYSNDSGIITATEVAPGWSTTKTFTLTGNIENKNITLSDKKVWYQLDLIVNENEFPDNMISYSLSVNNETINNGQTADAKMNKGLPSGQNLNGINLGMGYFAVGSNKHVYDLTLNYNNLGEDSAVYNKKLDVYVKASTTESVLVELDLNGGQIAGSIVRPVKKSGSITLEEPTKKGYIFKQWVITEGTGTVDGNTINVEKDSLKVTAVWATSSNQVVVVQDLIGGTTTDSMYKVVEKNSTVELVEPTRYGYSFNGWSLVGEVEAQIDGNIITVKESDVLVKANWTSSINKVTLTDFNTYKFINVKDKYTWESNNENTSSTTSTSTWEVVSDGNYELTWSVSSETNCDILKISLDGAEVVSASGEQYGRIVIPKGTHTVKATYAKDGSKSIGLDKAIIKFNTLEVKNNQFYLNGEIADKVNQYGTYYENGNAINYAVPIQISDYGFQFIENNIWESNNTYISGATSSTTWNITSDGNYELTWSVSSEPNNDILKISIDGTEVVNTSGEQFGRITLPKGTHTVSATYSKDSNTNIGLDKAKIRFSTVTTNSEGKLIIDGEIADKITYNNVYYKNGVTINYANPIYYGAYSFNLKDNNIWQSNNTYIGGGIASTTWNVTSNGNYKLVWSVSSEAGCDTLKISIDGTEVVNASGQQSGEKIIESGTHLIAATYTKDGGTNGGLDKAKISFVEINN